MIAAPKEGMSLVCTSTSVTLAEGFRRARHFGLAWHYSQSGRRASKEENALAANSRLHVYRAGR